MSTTNESTNQLIGGNNNSEASFITPFIKHKSYPSYELRDKQQRIANTIQSFDYTAIHSLSSLTSPVRLDNSTRQSVPGHNIGDCGGNGMSLHNSSKANSSLGVVSRDGCKFVSPAKMRWLLLRQLSGIDR